MHRFKKSQAMKLDGRRQSTNVEDRRGKGGVATAGGLGLGGIVILGLIWLLTGKAPDSSTLQQMTQGAGTEYAQEQDYSEVALPQPDCTDPAKMTIFGGW